MERFYMPTNQTRDGKERSLRIEVAETFDGKRFAAIGRRM